MYTLNDICLLITDGSHFSPEDEGVGYPMLSVKDMYDDYFDTKGCKHVGEATFQKLVANGCNPQVNDVVVAKDGSFLKTAFAIKEKQDIVLLSSIAILRPKLDIIVPDYLSCFLKSDYVYRTVSLNYISGTALKRIILKGLKKIPIEVPKLEEQQHRVNLLNVLQIIIRQRREELLKLDDLIKARFVEMFGDPISNNFGWKQVLLREVTSKIGSGATPRGGKESYQTEGITLIRSMNVHDGRFEYKDLAHITDEQATQLNNVIVKEGDVFINITGASVARSCIVPSNALPARVNQHVAIIRCIYGRLHPVFVNYMFLNDRFKRRLLDIGDSGGATRQAITKQQLENLVVILPPMILQHKFAAFVAQIDKSKVAVQKSLDKAQQLFDSLMQKYFG